MKLNSTATFTLVLLFLMLGAGIVSATSGYSIGSDALKGITQPDSRPTAKGNSRSRENSPQEANVEGMPLLNENEIIKEAVERMNTAQGSASNNADRSTTATSEAESADRKAAKFPFMGQDKGVKLEVNATRRQGDTVVFDVAIQNESNQSVKFLYSFLSITDDQGRVLNGETGGLPAELAPKSERYTGTVKVSSSLLDNAKKVSIQLSDYPNQQIQLEVSEIPVQ